MGTKIIVLFFLFFSVLFPEIRAVETAPVVPWDENGPVHYRVAPEGLIADWKADPAYDYERNRKPGWWQWILDNFLLRLSPQGFDLSWLNYVFKGLVALVFVYFVLRMLNVPVGGLVTSVFKNKGHMVALPDSEPGEAEGSLEERWLLCRSSGAYREATRLLYLQLLQQLQGAGFIRIKSGKTNREYLRELSVAGLREELSPLVRIYDYVWFGQIQPDEVHYQWIETLFIRHLNSLTKQGNDA